MGLVDGKVAFVTGAGQGIGEGTAHALAMDGASVAVVGRTFSKVEKVANDIKSKGFKAMAIQCDVSQRDSVDKAVEKTVKEFGTIDILINNAMTQKLVPFEMQTEEDLLDAYKSSVLGTFNCMKACFTYLKEHGGKVVNFGSAAGTHGEFGMSTYGAAKEAVRGLSKCLAVEWGQYNINVNVVCPNGNSPAWEQVKKDYGPEACKKMLEGHLIIREDLSLGDPIYDVGRAVVFLSSAYSNYITGRTLHVDGGKSSFR